jgi:hypothetical protein
MPEYLYFQRTQSDMNDMKRAIADRTINFVDSDGSRLSHWAWNRRSILVTIQNTIVRVFLTQQDFQNDIHGLALTGTGVGNDDYFLVIQNPGNREHPAGEWRDSERLSAT